MVLNPDFKEFIKLLNDNHVRYLIVGGYAVAFHGHPRYTKDLDFWIEPALANAEKLVKVLIRSLLSLIGRIRARNRFRKAPQRR